MTGVFATEAPPSAPPGPPVQKPSTWLEQAGAAWRTAQDDDEAQNLGNKVAAYNALESALVDLGHPIARYRNPEWRSFFNTPETAPQRLDTLWGDVQAERAKDPRRFADVPKTREEFDRWGSARQGGRAADQDILARGDSTTAQLLPSLGVGLLSAAQPENLPYMAIGGGSKTLAGLMAREFVTNATGAVINAPAIERSRANMGETYGGWDPVIDVATAGAAGSVLAGGIHVGGEAAGKIAARLNPPDRQMAGALEHAQLPDVGDQEIVRRFQEAVPAEIRTPDEQAAVHVIDRQADIDAVNPFVPGPAGMDVHAGRLQSSIDALMSVRTTAAVPILRPMGDDGAAAFKAQVRSRESAGDDRAQSASSSASGRYQFTRPTFVSLYQQAFGKGLDTDAIWAKRFDPSLQEMMMDRAIGDYRQRLNKAGLDADPGNLYLMHFLGPKAIDVLKAAPDAPIGRLVKPNEIAANPRLLEGKTAGDVVAWARQAMGAPGDGHAAEVPAIGEDAAMLRSPDLDAARPVITPSLSRLELARFRPDDIGVDADLMQFKSGGDTEGVTDRLQGISEWDPMAAGAVTVWEANDGRRLIADGHQRLGLAKRLAAADPTQDIRLRAFVLREADGFTADQARLVTALKNIGEGTGSATDAAKIFRDAGEEGIAQLIRRLPPRSPLVRDGKSLAKLSPEAFGAVINDVIPESHGAAIGELAADRGTHSALVDLLAKLEPANRRQAEGIVRQALEAGFTTEHQNELFGTRSLTSSLFLDRARVLDRGLAELKKLKGVFQTAAANADALEGAGSRIAVDAATREAATNAHALALIEKLAYTKGHVGDLLNSAAEQLAKGRPLAAVVRQFVADVRGLRLDDLGGAGERTGGPGGLADGGGRLDLADDGPGRAQSADGDHADLTPATRDELEAAGQAGFSLFDPPELKAFDDPAGAGAKAVADSLEHDLKADLKATVDQSAAGDGLLGPASILGFLPREGKPGISLVDEEGHFITAVFRDADGRPQGAVRMATSPEGREITNEVSSYVKPEFRRQGVATDLYDALRAAGHPIDEVSGTGDLSPDGAAFVNARRKAATLDRGSAIDPAIADRQRQHADLKAKAPMQAKAEQDGTMGLGLFDSADAPTFRLDEGDERPIADILKEIDADEAAIAAARACL